jgi:hypothetical protein
LDAADMNNQEACPVNLDESSEEGLKRQQQAHAAHHRFSKSAAAVAVAPSVSAPSAGLDTITPEVLEKLEELDDLVYEAISGHPDTMEQLRVAWPKIAGELGETLLAESREQYLRYALSIWDECTDVNGIRNPMRAIQALDVLTLLFGDAS